MNSSLPTNWIDLATAQPCAGMWYHGMVDIVHGVPYIVEQEHTGNLSSSTLYPFLSCRDSEEEDLSAIWIFPKTISEEHKKTRMVLSWLFVLQFVAMCFPSMLLIYNMEFGDAITGNFMVINQHTATVNWRKEFAQTASIFGRYTIDAFLTFFPDFGRYNYQLSDWFVDILLRAFAFWVTRKVLSTENFLSLADSLEELKQAKNLPISLLSDYLLLGGTSTYGHSKTKRLFRNLEDCLHCKGKMRPLSVKNRIKIMKQVCKKLMYLHSSENPPGIHGDLKPENIFLDTEFQCKLIGAGKGRLLEQDVHATISFESTFPNGSYSYIDPEYLITGEVTPLSDIYSFGVIVLWILTGRCPIGLVNDMKDALERGELMAMLDESAGKWPPMEVEQLAKIALTCCDKLGENRPNLIEVVTVLDDVENSLCSQFSLPKVVSYSDIFAPVIRRMIFDENSPPSYFICPITQDVMRDPVMAADGYTYEAEAIKKWLENGRTTSPMTNLELSSSAVIPNHTLHSAIEEWKIQRNDVRSVI